MHTIKNSMMTRRRFLLLGALGGVAIATDPFVSSVYGSNNALQRLTMETVLMRNPAFSLRKDVEHHVLIATTSNGRRLQYRMDDEGMFLWDNTPRIEDHLQGKVLTVRSILDLAMAKYGKRKDSRARKEAFVFIKEAYEAGIFVGPGSRMYVAFNPARR